MNGPARDAIARLETHEEVCAVRYQGINARLKRMEGIMIAQAGGVIAMLFTVILAIVKLGG